MPLIKGLLKGESIWILVGCRHIALHRHRLHPSLTPVTLCTTTIFRWESCWVPATVVDTSKPRHWYIGFKVGWPMARLVDKTVKRLLSTNMNISSHNLPHIFQSRKSPAPFCIIWSIEHSSTAFRGGLTVCTVSLRKVVRCLILLKARVKSMKLAAYYHWYQLPPWAQTLGAAFNGWLRPFVI